MLGIVTVQWNSSEHTVNFIESVCSSLGRDVHLVIIDNGSRAAHLAALKDKITAIYKSTDNPENALLTLIENKHNSGFARANNVGINYCLKHKESWIWLLNNDTTQSVNTVAGLIEKLKTCSPGIFGTKISEINKPEIYAGFVFNKWTSRYRAISQDSLYLLDNSLSYISGASMLINHEVFQHVGLLDESTFLYFEELDFCIRSRDYGYKPGFLPEISISHTAAGSASSSELQNLKTYHETWSTLNFYSRHQKALLPVMLLFRTAVKLMMLALKSRRSEIKTVLTATVDFLKSENKDSRPVEIGKVSYYR